MEDLLALRTAGAAAVLVGSAMHDGRIGRKQLDRLAAKCESPRPTPFTRRDVHPSAEESPRHSTSAD